MKNFRVIKFSRFRSIREIFLPVDDCSMDERLDQESQGSLAVVVDRTFTSGSVDLRAQAYSLIIAT